jgi:hypothetical protein
MTDDISAVLNDFSSSFWLKENYRALLDRDPVDAFNDSEFLYLAMRSRLEALRGESITLISSEGKK